jgi:drug/metabolite transporter (DMT)-like permease
MRNQYFATGVSFTLLSAVGLALIGLFGKLGAPLFSLEALIFWRFLAAFLFCTAFMWFIGHLHQIRSAHNPKMDIVRAVFVLGAQYSFYYYIQRAPLMNGMVLLSLGPLFIPFIERLLTGAAIGKSTWIGLGVSFVGMLCVLQPDAGIFSLLSLVGVLSGLSQACSQVVFGMTSKDEQTYLSTWYMFVLCLPISLIPYFIDGHTWAEGHNLTLDAVLIVFGMGIASILNQLARAVAYHHSTPSRLATFLYFAIFLGGIFDWLVFKNPPNLLSLIGAALVILGGVLKIYLRALILKKK